LFPITKSQQPTLDLVAALVANLAVPDFQWSIGCFGFMPYWYFLQFYPCSLSFKCNQSFSFLFLKVCVESTSVRYATILAKELD